MTVMAVSFLTTILLLRLLDSTNPRTIWGVGDSGVTRIYQDGLMEPDIYQAYSNNEILMK